MITTLGTFATVSLCLFISGLFFTPEEGVSFFTPAGIVRYEYEYEYEYEPLDELIANPLFIRCSCYYRYTYVRWTTIVIMNRYSACKRNHRRLSSIYCF